MPNQRKLKLTGARHPDFPRQRPCKRPPADSGGTSSMLLFWLACPGCGRHFDFHLGDYDFYRFLGPPRYICPKCGTVYRSDRIEWAELSVIGKLLWLFCSALLVAGTGLLGGISVMVARHLLAGGQGDPN